MASGSRRRSLAMLLATFRLWPVAAALAAGVVALGRQIRALQLDVHAGVEALGVATFAGEHFVAFHNSPESILLGIPTQGPPNGTFILPAINEDREKDTFCLASGTRSQSSSIAYSPH
jgi:hypothetical protein